MNYKSEIAEMTKFFRSYISLNNTFSELRYGEPAFEEAVRSILSPFSYKTYSLMRRELRTISVEPDVLYDAYRISIKTDVSDYPPCCIEIREVDIRIMVLVPPEKGRIPIAATHIYYNFRFLENTFNFFLNYDLLYNIAPPRTKEVLQRIYNSMTGGIK